MLRLAFAITSSTLIFGVLTAMAQAAAPVAVTRWIEVTGSTSANVVGAADPYGAVTTLLADYGIAGSTWCASHGMEGEPVQTTPQLLGGGEIVFSEAFVALERLAPATEYCAELVAQNAYGTSYGGQVVFTTQAHSSFPPEPPEVPTPESTGTPFKSEISPWVIEAGERAAGEAVQRSREAQESAAREASEREALEAERKNSTAPAAQVLCVVPRLRGKSLPSARKALEKAHCRLGKVSRPAKPGAALVVTAQSIRAGRTLANDGVVAVRLAVPVQSKAKA
jgi:hypothetical protein